LLLLLSSAESTALSLGGPDSVIVYRQKETFRRQAQLDAAANMIRRRRRSDAADTSTLSLSFAVSNATEGVLVCSQSSDAAFTVLYVRKYKYSYLLTYLCVLLSFLFTDFICLSVASVMHNTVLITDGDLGQVRPYSVPRGYHYASCKPLKFHVCSTRKYHWISTGVMSTFCLL